MEDDLTWLARNVTDSHMCDWYIKVADGYSSMTGGTPTGMSGTWCSRKQIIQRRAELQNKPSWADAPEWATHLAQNGRGQWWFMLNGKLLGDSGRYFESDRSTIEVARGEVLGDWRDTLERRPVDLSEPAGGVKERGADGAEEINAMAQRLLVALKSDPRSFDTGALAEMVELADAEIVKRDAKVCGGEGYLNNHWFERGELPPVGEFVDVEGEDLVYGDGELNCEVIAHVEDTAVIRMSYGLGCFQKHVLSPSRTERDKAIDDMRQHFPYPGSLDTIGLAYAAALYDAGYRKQNLPAK
ncbi:TPA: hypothetical protein ACSP2N_001503 [Aeromonas veronii]